VPVPQKVSTALLADPLFKDHLTGPMHPERPERFDAVMKRLSGAEFYGDLKKISPRKATEEELMLCHKPEYIRTVQRDVASGSEALSTGDTAISERSLDVALEAAGGVLNVVDAVMSGGARNAFCVVRPPGHHATPARGMGFCVFNNIAIAARYAQKRHGAGRVLIADWDVHHGNGTQDCFYSDGSVFFMSTHQSPWYPGTGMSWETGEGDGRGTTLNCPFPAGAGREEILGAFRGKLLPAANQFKPDVVFLSAGFDSRLGDPLGRFTLSDDDFAELTTLMLEIAETHAAGRLISVLEGGYSLDGLASAAVRHVATLCAV
jgi:acetoin utilization deacetylase AcuC-like enzyme